VFATVAVVLAFVGITASIVPARRAASVDPIVVLRHS
jgi:ABC-type lipoprotein release transport system permease subunit